MHRKIILMSLSIAVALMSGTAFAEERRRLQGTPVSAITPNGFVYATFITSTTPLLSFYLPRDEKTGGIPGAPNIELRRPVSKTDHFPFDQYLEHILSAGPGPKGEITRHLKIDGRPSIELKKTWITHYSLRDKDGRPKHARGENTKFTYIIHDNGDIYECTLTPKNDASVKEHRDAFEQFCNSIKFGASE